MAANLLNFFIFFANKEVRLMKLGVTAVESLLAFDDVTTGILYEDSIV